MNLIDGTIRRTAAGVVIDTEGAVLDAPDMPGLVDGQKVIFGIRPEHLELADTGFKAQVAVVEPTGSETHVVFRVGIRNLVAVFRERQTFKVGDSVPLKPQTGLAHLFDAASGDRL